LLPVRAVELQGYGAVCALLREPIAESWMSLVGSLEDLGLGDILQIVSLSRKSGRLLLRSEEGEGRIVFCDGLVRAAFVKGEAEDLRGLLLGGGFIEEDAFDSAAEEALARGVPISDILAKTPDFSKERIDSLRREQVERSVFRMFGWKTGEFSFEIRDEVDDRDRELLLRTGINAQYITMEATRIGDERGKGRDDDDIEFGTIDEPSADESSKVSTAGSDSEQVEGEDDAGAEAVEVELGRSRIADALAMAGVRRAESSAAVATPPAREAVFEDSVEPESAQLAGPPPAEITATSEEFDTSSQESDIAVVAEPEDTDEEAEPAADGEMVFEETESVDPDEPVAEEDEPVADGEMVFEETESVVLDGSDSEETEPEELTEAVVEGADPAVLDEVGVAEGEPEAREEAVAATGEAVTREETDTEEEPLSTNFGSLVLIDPNLTSLEWQKSVLGPLFRRIHIFQRSDGGISRIRQYLRRGEEPIVLVSDNVPGDPMCGIADPIGLIRRLRAHDPHMSIFLVQSGDEAAPTRIGAANGLLKRPADYQLANRRAWGKLEAAGTALREGLRSGVLERTPKRRASQPSASRTGRSGAPGDRSSARSLRRLKQMSDRLRDPSVRGEVLSLILEFAAESFSRVAIFMVRDDVAVGMAEAGLARAGGPSGDAFREISISADEPAWFRAVLEHREGFLAPPGNEGDRKLAALLGSQLPQEAYVAPIESSHRVVALVYVDNLPAGGPIGETTSLEIVLHEAGLALERALLERALADAADRDDA
jgi:hypothetical protein